MTDPMPGQPVSDRSRSDFDAASDARREAVDYVRSLRGLYIHAIVFAGVSLALFVVDMLTGPDWWVHWVLLGWGIGLLAHAAAVYLGFSMFGPEWERREVERRLMRTRS